MPTCGRAGPAGERSGSIAPDLRTKRIYASEDPADGARVLIMRLWPRGVRKDRVTVWLRELGPPLPLLLDFRHHGLSWEAYRHRYLAGLERPEAQTQVTRVLELVARGPVTLLCGCPDEARCHRTLLKEYLSRRML
jgi:uncharacterized protein YeaO (DUF488 family)